VDPKVKTTFFYSGPPKWDNYVKVKKAMLRKGGTIFLLWVQENEEVSERTRVQSEPKEDSEADERSCYTLLAFICLKMEVTWQSKTHRKSGQVSTFYQEIDPGEFYTKSLTVPALLTQTFLFS